VKLKFKEGLCSGCRVCEAACAMAVFGEENPKKAALKVRGHFPAPGTYDVAVCDQCGECAEACPVEAIKKVDGHYEVNTEECTGCLLCVEACPRGVMFTHRDHEAPFKCTLCGTCIEFCPRGALVDEEAMERGA
jgi:Fe-S-cluster-containing hydrogenase component 2